MSSVTAKAVDWTETGLVPDSVIRAGIRRLLERKLKEIHAGDVEKAAIIKNRFVQMMGESPIALCPVHRRRACRSDRCDTCSSYLC